MAGKLRPAFAVMVVAILLGKLVLPNVKSESSAQAFVPAAAQCQTEFDNVESAAAELGEAVDDLALAKAVKLAANNALWSCEMTTPGQCQQQEQDVDDAVALVQAAQQDVDDAEFELLSAQYEYHECRYGCP